MWTLTLPYHRTLKVWWFGGTNKYSPQAMLSVRVHYHKYIPSYCKVYSFLAVSVLSASCLCRHYDSTNGSATLHRLTDVSDPQRHRAELTRCCAATLSSRITQHYNTNVPSDRRSKTSCCCVRHRRRPKEVPQVTSTTTGAVSLTSKERWQGTGDCWTT